jgi:lipoprotein-anchoring transpeptidase ErfK/SrfK
VARVTKWLALAVVSCAAVAGCTVAAASPPPPPPPPPVPTVSVDPPDGAKDVVPAETVTVRARHGTLADVTLTDDSGTTIPGRLSADHTTWTAAAPTKFHMGYHFGGTASGPGGTAPVTGGFSTVDAAGNLFAVSSNIGDGEVVGVAAPVILQFDSDIPEAQRATVERALSIHTSIPVEGSWAWLPDTDQGSRIHWRPKYYWTPGTTVSVAADVYGVDAGSAGYGSADLTTTFTIGRSQIVQANAKTHHIQIVRDHKVVMDLPASYGADSDPRRVTRSGVHIVMGKTPLQLMSNPEFGYKNVPEQWAVRISNNGEFIHANPASSYAQGRYNVTHGCINLSTGNAKSYYDTALFGDPVEITGTSVMLSAADGDVYDWAVPWDQWLAMSALH